MKDEQKVQWGKGEKMKILKEEMNKLFSEAKYQRKTKYEDTALNDFYNCWCFFEEKETEIQNIEKESVDSILYTKYYWFTKFKERYEQLYGFDAGIEQQQYKIIEELQVRMNENLDWNIIRLMEEESQ
ncbi:MAG: hypothetical protein IJ530_11760 [Treponema sp.]|uniref:hypothetical protein n=1 Tax=Treponema sp. TaxID=166 RepID=UPI0025F7392A|nr:hypothetical protein [Treponema sp.]MBQ8680421.1 hypothetical protein [Treponema sp.]